MTDQELRNLVAENSKAIAELRKSQNQTDEQMKKTDEQMKKTDKKLDKTIATLNGLGVTQGEISEDLVFDNFERLFEEYGKKITKIYKNLEIPGKCEFDIIGVNGSEVFVTETKTRLTKKHIDDFLATRLVNFRKYVKEYDKYKLYGVVGTRVFAKGIQEYASKKGLFLIKEYNNGNAKFLNSPNFEAKEIIV